MAGTILLTGANSSLGIPAVEHLLTTYPDHTALLTVRDDSESDINTQRLRETISRFRNAKVKIKALDLASLTAVHTFADQIRFDISNTEYPPLSAIIANAYYWNLVKGPEITPDGFDKTIQVAHIAHSALILRLLGSFGEKGRIVLLSSEAHWSGKNFMQKYAPIIPEDLDELIRPFCDADKSGRGFQRYSTAKLAVTTWLYPLNRYLQADASLSKICAVAIDPGNLIDSRALFVLKPLLPLLKLAMGPKLRRSAPAGVDVIELSVNAKYVDKRAYYTMSQESESSPDSKDEEKQEKLWNKTLEWAKITSEKTTLKLAS
ncbi:putative short-chain dehydrogenase [Lophiostoma macrostomum CBS 122681]|uniref:Putative short-chain dehydrogenase n=1 Tax=Lophiostoma macrostomum CBS 122681 TaxID=1314788 RepID=A0A6A6TDD6_9PLEO|nr:putative short-chain dehydrogenase [Lophiostoma macrostomum CBS 122681]